MSAPPYARHACREGVTRFVQIVGRSETRQGLTYCTRSRAPRKEPEPATALQSQGRFISAVHRHVTGDLMMLRNFWRKSAQRLARGLQKARTKPARRFQPAFESLDERLVPAVTAT